MIQLTNTYLHCLITLEDNNLWQSDDASPVCNFIYFQLYESVADLIKGVLYISTLAIGNAKERIDAAVSAFIASFEEQSTVEKLYNLFYVQSTNKVQATSKDGIYTMASSSLDLAFDDATLDSVEDAWKSTLTEDEDVSSFMTFEVREQMHGEDDDDDE